MPSCTVINKTGQPLNIALKQVAALHFENTVKPDQEVKFKPGRVWFTLEVQVDDGSSDNRYSVLKSAATIGLLSLAVGAVAASAGAALLPASATAGAVASATAAGSYLSKAGWVAKTALVKNAGTIGKISSVAVPKAVEKLSSEMGGLTSLQKEVLSIVASPTLSSDVRNKATHMLKSLYGAYTTDKANPTSTVSTPVAVNVGAGNTATTREAQNLNSELDDTHAESHIENVPVQSGVILRVHGIYMDRRRHFEIRVNSAGLLELWDGETRARWNRKLEAERDKLEKASLKREEKEDKENKKAELEGNNKEKKGGWGWSLRKSKKGTGTETDESDGDNTDVEGDGDGDSTSVMIDDEKEGQVKVLERRPTVKERLEGLVHPTPETQVPEDVKVHEKAA